MGKTAAGRWCDCAEAPRHARGAATLLEHPTLCEFPEGICFVREHRATVVSRARAGSWVHN